MMSEGTFEKIINELSQLNYRNRILLYNNNECLMDERLIEFTRVTRDKCPHADVQIETNGILLDVDLAQELMNAGMNRIIINNYNTGNNPIPSIKNFLAEAHKLSLSPKQNITIIFREKNEVLSNMAGNAPNKKGPASSIRDFCSWPFIYLPVIHDGSVPICCCDFYGDEIMGNVNEDSLLNIWVGSKFRRVREKLLRNDRTFSLLCQKCDWHDGILDLIARSPFAETFSRIASQI